MQYDVNWIKCNREKWYNLLNLDLSDPHFEGLVGVYIIWHGGNNPATVRIGQGVIRDRLAKHKQDPEILRYQEYGLFVTWAQVPEQYLDGVERYLGEVLNQIVGSRLPDVSPIRINLPW